MENGNQHSGRVSETTAQFKDHQQEGGAIKAANIPASGS